MGATDPCSVAGCPSLRGRGGAHGYCSSHNHRWQRYGDPLATSLTRPRGEYGRPAVVRFLSRINFDGPDGCWLHPGRKQDGYAVVETHISRRDGASRTVSVPGHRYMWWIIFGECPAGELDHFVCYRPNCVNWQHVEPVTRAEHLLRGNERRRREREAYRLLERLHPELLDGL